MTELKSNAEVNIGQLAIELLEEGKEYGYSELCKTLGVRTYKNGTNAYKTQLKYIFDARHMDEVYGEYRGRKVKRYKVGKVKAKTLALEEKKGAKMSPQKKSMYLYMLEFLYMLATEGTCAEHYEEDGCWKVTLTNNALFKGLQLVNKNNYDIALCDPKYFCEHTGVNEDILSEVMGAVTSNNSDTIYRMLEKLEKLDLIYFVKTAMIGNNEIIMNEDTYNKSNIREANFRENGKIRKIKRKILNDMNMVDERDVYVKGQKSKFYNELRSKLYSEMGIQYYCPVYSITYDKESILGFIEVLKNNPEIDMNLESSSSKFINNLKSNAHKRRENAFNSKSRKMTPKRAVRMLDFYEEHSDKVLDNLHISSDNIPKNKKCG